MLALNLISHEQATENLGQGSWDENFKKILKEKDIIPKEEVVVEPNKVKNDKTSTASK